MHWDNGWHDSAGGPWSWLFMALMMMAFWGGLAWLIVTLILHSSGKPHPAAPPAMKPLAERPTAEDILHERLARGEIDVDEYHQRIDALRVERSASP